MTYRMEALGFSGATRAALVATPTRRTFLAGVFACVANLALSSRSRAYADVPVEEDGGYLTLSGVVGVDEGRAFSSLQDAFSAVSACGVLADGLTVLVHGTVTLGAAVAEVPLLADGAAFALVAAGSDSCLVAGPGCAIAHVGGSLILSGLSCSGALSLSCRDNLAIDACSFDAGLACTAGGDVSVAGSAFAGDGSGDALAVNLASATSTFAFTSNEVADHTCAVAASCSDGAGAGALVVTANRIAVTPSADASWNDSCIVRLDGGAWSASSIVRNGNSVVSAGALLQLAPGFSACSADDSVQSLAADNLTAQTVVSLFELTGTGTSTLPDATVGVAMDPAYAESASFSQIAEASELVLPGHSATRDDGESELNASGAADGTVGAADVVASCIVFYDGNGATGGDVPAPAEVGAGASVTVAGMGTLVRVGYSFAGWNTQPDGSGTFFAAGQVVAPSADVVLYAQWTATGTVATVFVSQAEGGA